MPEDCASSTDEPMEFDGGSAFVWPAPTPAGWLGADPGEMLLTEHSGVGAFVQAGSLSAAAAEGNHAFGTSAGGTTWLSAERVDGTWRLESWKIGQDLTLPELSTYRATGVGPESENFYSSQPSIVSLADGDHFAITLPDPSASGRYLVWWSDPLREGEDVALFETAVAAEGSNYLRMATSDNQLAFQWPLAGAVIVDGETLVPLPNGRWDAVAPRSGGGWWVVSAQDDQILAGWIDASGREELGVASRCIGGLPDCPRIQTDPIYVVEAGDGAVVAWSEYLGAGDHLLRLLQIDADAQPVGCSRELVTAETSVQGLSVLADEVRVIWTGGGSPETATWGFSKFAWAEPLPLGP